MDNTFNTIIIEDNFDHYDFIKILLNKFCPALNVVGHASKFTEAEKLLMKHETYDIIFLDINLGEDCSFDLLRKIPNLENKEIIITSSHDDYALEAFKYLTTDYILKPINGNDLKIAANRAIQNIELKKRASYQNTNNDSRSKPLKLLAIPSLNEVQIIAVEDILYLQSEGRYTIFNLTNDRTKLACKNLGEYEKLLKENRFFRIHHSYLVNMEYARNLNKREGYYLELEPNYQLPVSKRKLDALYRFLNLK